MRAFRQVAGAEADVGAAAPQSAIPTVSRLRTRMASGRRRAEACGIVSDRIDLEAEASLEVLKGVNPIPKVGDLGLCFSIWQVKLPVEGLTYPDRFAMLVGVICGASPGSKQPPL